VGVRYYESVHNLDNFENFCSGHSHATTTPQPGHFHDSIS
jgi:hypothetical protein